MDALASMASSISSTVPLLVAMFTFKGGVGKTTLTILLATMLAKLGFNVLIIDGDRQRNATTFFAEAPEDTPRNDDDDEEDDDDDDDGDAAGSSKKHDDAEQALARDRAHVHQIVADILKQQAGDGKFQLPDIQGDELAADLRPITSDYLIPQKSPDDTLHTALNHFIIEGPRPVKLTEVQKDTYTGKDGTGKMYLLQGASSQEMEDLARDYKAEGNTRFKTLAAFRRMALHCARQVGAHYVLLDMGPSTDEINRTFATSCDIIQPCASPDSFSWSSATEMVTEVLPGWLEWWARHVSSERAQPSLLEGHRYNSCFPRIMPFMALKYAWDPARNKVRWADSNFMQSITDAFHEIRTVIEEEEQGQQQQRQQQQQGGDDSSEDICMEDYWREHLRPKLRQGGYRDRLKLIMEGKMVRTSGGQVIVPLLRNFTFMTVCHEVGRALFDISEGDLADYYYEPGTKLTRKDKAFIKGMYKELQAEASCMDRNMRSLAMCYAQLLAEHVHGAGGQGQGQQKGAAGASPAAGASGGKRGKRVQANSAGKSPAKQGPSKRGKK